MAQREPVRIDGTDLGPLPHSVGTKSAMSRVGLTNSHLRLARKSRRLMMNDGKSSEIVNIEA